MSRFKTAVTIAQPREVVWAVLTDPATWQHWYGGGLECVDPRWAKGALLRWNLGEPSSILQFSPTQILTYRGSRGVDSTYSLEQVAVGETAMEYSEDFTASDLAVTDSAAVESRVRDVAERLKSFVETKGVRYAGRGAERKRGWRLWRWLRAKTGIPTALPTAAHTAITPRGDDDAVLRDLQSGVKGIRVEAAKALGELGVPEASGALFAAMRTDREEDVRRAAAQALDKLGWIPRNEEERVVYLIARERWNECLEVGPTGIRALIDVHRLQNGKWRNDPASQAQEVLAAAGAAAVEPLIDALTDEDSWTRVYAADVLGRIGDRRAAVPLLAALESENEYVVMATAEALVSLRDTGAAPTLISVLEDKGRESWRREQAAELLGKLGDTRAVEPLGTALEDAKVDVRRSAAEALGQLGDTRGASVFIADLQDQNSYIRGLAEEALERIGGSEAERALAEYRSRMP